MKVAWFECTATIDDVVCGSPWYYISCGGCNSKAFKGPTSLIATIRSVERVRSQAFLSKCCDHSLIYVLSVLVANLDFS